MVVCKKCHTSMSRRKHSHHYRGCVPEGTKGFEHNRRCKSHAAKLKKSV